MLRVPRPFNTRRKIIEWHLPMTTRLSHVISNESRTTPASKLKNYDREVCVYTLGWVLFQGGRGWAQDSTH